MPSSKKESRSTSSAMRSRAVRRPFLCWLSMAFSPPPSEIFSSSLRTWETSSARNRMLASNLAEVGSTFEGRRVVEAVDSEGAFRSAIDGSCELVTVYQGTLRVQTAMPVAVASCWSLVCEFYAFGTESNRRENLKTQRTLRDREDRRSRARRCESGKPWWKLLFGFVVVRAGMGSFAVLRMTTVTNLLEPLSPGRWRWRRSGRFGALLGRAVSLRAGAFEGRAVYRSGAGGAVCLPSRG